MLSQEVKVLMIIAEEFKRRAYSSHIGCGSCYSTCITCPPNNVTESVSRSPKWDFSF